MKQKSLKLIIVAFLFLLAACGGGNDASSSQSNDNSTANNQSSQSNGNNQNDQDENIVEDPLVAIEMAWESSAHASTFVLDKNGENNDCAQCHSPQNWMPSMDSIPEGCLTCKFEIADPIPLVEEHEWTNIPCMTCHKLDKKDNVEPDIYWLEIAQIEQYAEVETSTELCQMCHQAKSGIDRHPGTQVAGAHADYDCDDCHDPHAATTSCSSAECHSTFGMEAEPVAGHDDDHQMVACVACHDGGGMFVGPPISDEQSEWTTFSSDKEDAYPVYSHNLVLEAACGRCHYSDNPWDLSGIETQP